MSGVKKIADAVVHRIGQVLIGKEEPIRLALACLFARGHLLIEDLPGMGKTTLARALAGVLGLEYTRIQFTSDLLPADIVGVSVYDRNNGGFEFHPGPLFSQVVLADEINRTTPKTQSALLEAMAEGQVSVEGETRALPSPFFVIATQNPVSQSGTFPLPESQLDRFLMRISLGYPDPAAERELLAGVDPRVRLSRMKACMDQKLLCQIQQKVTEVQASDSVVDYLQELVQQTRSMPDIEHGISPRGSMALLQCARACALMDGRRYVIPEDIQTCFIPVCNHRLRGTASEQEVVSLLRQVLDTVDIL
ncbi:MAG TPA: AAA family ATPase [Porticoccaceae bacterium]|nr:AAA family ATPase [Porticoccaceae bacterium]